MDIEWVQIRSWHAVATATRVANTYKTLCGRRASGAAEPELPAGKSCESCLRIVARKADA